jgi:hypothetical protein
MVPGGAGGQNRRAGRRATGAVGRHGGPCARIAAAIRAAIRASICERRGSGTAVEGLVCDRCGRSLLVGEDVRYVVEVKVYAAYDVLEVTREDLERAGDPERWRRLIDACTERSAQELEDEVYRAFRFDLCMGCQREYLKAPLPPARQPALEPERGSAPPP